MSRALRVAAPLALGLGVLLIPAAPARAAMSAPPTIARLVNAGLDADAAGKAKHEVRRDRTRFSVEVEKLPAGRYELRVGGAEKASLAVNALGRGKAEFSTRRSGADRIKLPLDFNPSGQLIEVAQGGSVFLSVVFPNVTGDGGGGIGGGTGGGTGGSGGGSGSGGGVGNGGGVPADQRTRVDLVSTGAIARAKGYAEYRVDSGRIRFKVEIEDVPAGSYPVFVDGAQRATLVAARNAASGEIEGQVEFDTRTEAGKLPLNFDPRGKLVAVSDGGATILQVVFP
jgi:hypothetical protein